MNCKKKEILKRKIRDKHNCGSLNCPRCVKNSILIDKMDEANIPAGYWLVGINNFSDTSNLKDLTTKYVTNLEQMYELGKSICFSGNQGIGKTMSAICILKSALKKNYSAYYITASDLLAEITTKGNFDLRTIIKNIDFLVIDELDSRFFVSNSTKELFSGIYESIFRTRATNLLPTIICTNETDDLLNVFYGPAVQSIDSLNHQYLSIYPVTGVDYRKKTQ